MLKIKVFIIASVLCLVTFVLSTSPVFVSSAEGDTVLQQIAGYKTWQRINKEPIKVSFMIDGASGSENTFIVDGQEVTNVRNGALSG